MSMNSTADIVPIPMIYSTLAMSLIGFLGNITIVLITIINKSLHSRCSILIGLLAFFDTIVCVYLVQLRIMMIFKMYHLPSSTCYLFSIYGLFALNMQSSLGLIIGFDRLYNVSNPLKYSRLPTSLYIALFLSCVIFSITITFIGYLNISTDISVPVCLPPTAYGEKSRIIWIGSNFIIAITVVVVYGMAQIRCQILRARHQHEQTMEMINRLMKSLTLVIAIYVLTWFLTISSLVVSQIVKFSAAVTAEINTQLGWLVIINASLNFFVYFWRTPEYRKAILRLYGLSRFGSFEPSVVAPISKFTNKRDSTVNRL